ncbi:MAG: metal ABC transporter permease [Alphaproteobacteria bacterium]|jgi:zinc transport system permease protein|nr:metal ABC transporter permease [Alphaproteobacteria bacterium]
MYDFIIYGLIGGIGLAFSLSILGNFIVWKRMSYIGDSIAHTSLLGIALGVLTSTMPEIMIIIVCFVLSSALILINKRFNISKDSLLILNTQFALAAGFVIISLMQNNSSLYRYLFGSILSIKLNDIIIIYITAAVVFLYVFSNWQKLLLMTINEDVAISEGINALRHDIIFVFVLSTVIAFSIKLAGVLLIPSLSIIPAILAYSIAKSPLQSMAVSFIAAASAVILGMILALYINVSPSALITLSLCSFVLLRVIYLSLFRVK